MKSPRVTIREPTNFKKQYFVALIFVEKFFCKYNRPFPSSKKSHLQGEAKCEAIDMKMIFNYDANKTHFHNKGFALSLVLKVRVFGTRKWPIYQDIFFLCTSIETVRVR